MNKRTEYEGLRDGDLVEYHPYTAIRKCLLPFTLKDVQTLKEAADRTWVTFFETKTDKDQTAALVAINEALKPFTDLPS